MSTSLKDRIAAKRGEIAAGRSKGIRPYKWKAGKTLFRIIPAKDGGDWDRRFGKMWLKSFDGQQKFSIGDRDITFGEPDPIKDMIFRAMREAPTEEIRDHYKEMLAATKRIFQVSILSVNGAPDPDAPADQPVIVEVSETQFDNILFQFETYLEMDEDCDLAGKDTGHVFTLQKDGTGYDTKYTFMATPKKHPISQDLIDKQHDLDAWIQGEFEGLEAKAIEFLGRLNGAAGITVAVNAGLLRGNGANAQLTGPTGATYAEPDQTVPASTPTGMSPAAVTKVIDAEVEEIDDTPVDAASDSAPAAASGSTDDTDDIDAILAGLG